MDRTPRRTQAFDQRTELMTNLAHPAPGHFQTDVPAMALAANHVFEVNDAIQVQLARLLQHLEPLMTEWQGAAAASFHALKDRWHQNAVALNHALRGIGDGLQQSQRNYLSSEDSTQQGFTGIAGTLG